jgi:beta-phosphoglucomutase
MNNTVRTFPKNLQAVLFDYDGVIVDSMGENYIAWKYAFEQSGITITEDAFYALEGMSPSEITQTLGKQFHLSAPEYEAIAQTKHAYYKAHNTFRLFPGVFDLLRSLKERHIRIALVTGGILPRVSQEEQGAVLAYFDVIVTSEMVARTKPYPDPYIKALKELGVDAKNAIVIENAPLGITSAHGAGIYCIAVPTSFPCSELEADLCVSDLNHVRLQLTTIMKPL